MDISQQEWEDDLLFHEARLFVCDEMIASDGILSVATLCIRLQEQYPELPEKERLTCALCGVDDYFQQVDAEDMDKY